MLWLLWWIFFSECVIAMDVGCVSSSLWHHICANHEQPNVPNTSNLLCLFRRRRFGRSIYRPQHRRSHSFGTALVFQRGFTLLNCQVSLPLCAQTRLTGLCVPNMCVFVCARHVKVPRPFAGMRGDCSTSHVVDSSSGERAHQARDERRMVHIAHVFRAGAFLCLSHWAAEGGGLMKFALALLLVLTDWLQLIECMH